MRYFNGFSLSKEEELFGEYIPSGDGVVVGFSYGAIKAFEYVLSSKNRVDRLILLSPAFFQNRKPSFIRTQLRYFKQDMKAYIQAFSQNVAYPSKVDISNYISDAKEDELRELLEYRWDSKKIDTLLSKGVEIEVFLGQKDKIIDSGIACEFFETSTTTYYLKGVGHLLR
jgi:esterase/lipase